MILPLRRFSRAALLLIATPAFAQLAQYGYVVGALEPSKSFLEKLDAPDKGKYLHYHIFVMTDAGVEYECVIDVNDVSPTNPLIYRIASLDGLSSAELAADFGPVMGATGAFHLISNTDPSYGAVLTPNESQRQAAGALDYIRHPGVLKALEGQPWQQMYAQTTSDPLQWSLPLLDNVFKFTSIFPGIHSSAKVFVFGGPFTTGGTGMHVVHQNQADTGTQYSGTNGTWQDGGVIIERHTSIGIDGPVHVSRSLLMVKFSNQTDFSAESNDLAKPAAPGHTLAPTTQSFPFGLIQGDSQTFGPFSAAELEVSTINAVAHPDNANSYPRFEVAVKNGPFTSLADPGDYVSTDYTYAAGSTYRAFLRDYSPMSIFFRNVGRPPLSWFLPYNVRSNFYVRVKELDSGGNDSAANATLVVSQY